MVASWLALSPWKGRSSEERPDGLSQCQHTLLVAVKQQEPWKSRVAQELLLRAGVSANHPPLLGLGRGHARGGTGGS